MWIFLTMFALLAGMALPVQFSINAQLRQAVESPFVASTISFLIGTVALLIASMFTGSLHIQKKLFEAPWWIWMGGLLGAFYVLATIVLTPRLGAATTVALLLTGQIIAAIMIDHFGLLEVPIHSLTVPRVLGVVMIIIGLILVQRY